MSRGLIHQLGVVNTLSNSLHLEGTRAICMEVLVHILFMMVSTSLLPDGR
jgi:hypothetical protein